MGEPQTMLIGWFWAILASLLALLASVLLFALLVRALSPYARSRGTAAGAILRLRFLGVLLFLSAPAWAFLHYSPAFEGKQTIQIAVEVVAVTSFSWILLEGITELFIYRLLSTQLGVGIPALVVDVIKGILYLGILAVVLHDFFRVNLEPLLTTSAVVTVIIGLAFQDTLGNVISGLALHFAAPYQVGDWIRIGDLEGKIARIEWRSTSILTRTNDMIAIPHVTMAKNEVYNFSAPSARHARELRVPLDYSYAPDRVIRSLTGAARDADGILSDPPPSAYILSFEETRVVYGLWVWIEDFEHLLDILNALSTRIWYALERSGFSLRPGKQRHLFERPEGEDERSYLADFFRSLSLFDGMEEAWLKSLASKTTPLRFADGELIIREGDLDHDFYIMYEGEVDALRNGSAFHAFRPGDFFGEMALLTGEPRSASIRAHGGATVLLFTREVLAPFMEAHPPFLQKLSDAIAARLKTIPSQELSREEEAGIQGQSIGSYILKRIRSFFLQRPS